MTEETSSTSHMSDAMTTQVITSGNNMTTSSTSTIYFYFRYVVLIIGVIGTASNALIVYALVASKQHKKHVLILNQNTLDLFTSVVTVVIYSAKLSKISHHINSSAGYWLCTLIISDSLIWFGAYGSVINLASITVERYLKVVWSRIKVRNWMIYSAMVFSWIGSLTYNAALLFSTSKVVDGKCHAYLIWDNETARIIKFVYNFVSFYVIIILIFIFCYWRILVVIRRQASVMAGYANAAGPSTAHSSLSQIQTNVIKTMIFVSAFYAIAWLPLNTFLMVFRLNREKRAHGVGAYLYPLSILLIHLYTCINPFIYATKFDPVKQVLLRLIRCQKNSESFTENIAMT